MDRWCVGGGGSWGGGKGGERVGGRHALSHQSVKLNQIGGRHALSHQSVKLNQNQLIGLSGFYSVCFRCGVGHVFIVLNNVIAEFTSFGFRYGVVSK